MAAEKYKVVFDGSPVENITIDVMKQNLIAQFKLSEVQQQRIFSGKQVILKQDLDYEAALKYQSTLEKLGAKTSVEPLQAFTLEPLSIEKEDVAAQDHRVDAAIAPPPPLTEEQTADQPHRRNADDFISCPKCGTEQPQSEQCIQCGIVFERYLEIQAKLDAGESTEQILPKHLGLRGRKKIDNRVGFIRFPGVKTLIISVFFLTCIFFALKNTRVWQEHSLKDTLKVQAQERCGSDAACEFSVRTQFDECLQKLDLGQYLDARSSEKEQKLAQLAGQLAECFVDDDGNRLF